MYPFLPSKKCLPVTPRGIYESVDPKTSGDVFHQAPSPHDRWVSIEKHTPGPVPVDSLIKKGQIRTADSREAWLNYSAERSKSAFQGARIEIRNLGDNRFKATTAHIDSYSLWLHPKMADLTRPIVVTTDGVTTKHTLKPSLLTALKGFERKEDWGLIYHATVTIETPRRTRAR